MSGALHPTQLLAERSRCRWPDLHGRALCEPLPLWAADARHSQDSTRGSRPTRGTGHRGSLSHRIRTRRHEGKAGRPIYNSLLVCESATTACQPCGPCATWHVVDTCRMTPLSPFFVSLPVFLDPETLRNLQSPAWDDRAPTCTSRIFSVWICAREHGKFWSTWSAVINLTSRAGELRSAPSEV